LGPRAPDAGRPEPAEKGRGGCWEGGKARMPGEEAPGGSGPARGLTGRAERQERGATPCWDRSMRTQRACGGKVSICINIYINKQGKKRTYPAIVIFVQHPNQATSTKLKFIFHGRLKVELYAVDIRGTRSTRCGRVHAKLCPCGAGLGSNDWYTRSR
jgi:hypothetical protein